MITSHNLRSFIEFPSDKESSNQCLIYHEVLIVFTKSNNFVAFSQNSKWQLVNVIDELAGYFFFLKAVPLGRTPCRINNGDCSHLCFLVPGGKHKCACPNGVPLQADNKTCSSGNVKLINTSCQCAAGPKWKSCTFALVVLNLSWH